MRNDHYKHLLQTDHLEMLQRSMMKNDLASTTAFFKQINPNTPAHHANTQLQALYALFLYKRRQHDQAYERYLQVTKKVNIENCSQQTFNTIEYTLRASVKTKNQKNIVDSIKKIVLWKEQLSTQATEPTKEKVLDLALANCYRELGVLTQDPSYFKLAIQTYQNLIRTAEGKFKTSARTGLARILLTLNKLDEAEAMLRTTLNEDPAHFTAKLSLASVIFLKDRKAGDQAYSDLIQRHNNNSHVYEVYARSLQNAQDFFQAKQVLSEGLKKTGGHLTLKIAYAYCLLVEKNFPASVRAFEKLLFDYQHHKDIINGYLISLTQNKEWEKITAYYLNHTQEIQRSKALLLAISIAYFQQNCYEEALNVIDTALTIDPHYSAALSTKGHILSELGKPAEQVLYFFSLANQHDKNRIHKHTPKSNENKIEASAYKEISLDELIQQNYQECIEKRAQKNISPSASPDDIESKKIPAKEHQIKTLSEGEKLLLEEIETLQMDISNIESTALLRHDISLLSKIKTSTKDQARIETHINEYAFSDALTLLIDLKNEMLRLQEGFVEEKGNAQTEEKVKTLKTRASKKKKKNSDPNPKSKKNDDDSLLNEAIAQNERERDRTSRSNCLYGAIQFCYRFFSTQQSTLETPPEAAVIRAKKD